MPSLRAFLTLIALAVFAATGTARADSPMFYSDQGSAISGYDPVAYFVTGRAVPGQAGIALVWKGVEWRFASLENRALFETDPRGFAPQFGGYCAYGLTKGRLVSTEPDAWIIHGGKLYLIHNTRVRGLWVQDISGHVAMAEAHWPHVLRD